MRPGVTHRHRKPIRGPHSCYWPMRGQMQAPDAAVSRVRDEKKYKILYSFNKIFTLMIAIWGKVCVCWIGRTLYKSVRISLQLSVRMSLLNLWLMDLSLNNHLLQKTSLLEDLCIIKERWTFIQISAFQLLRRIGKRTDISWVNYIWLCVDGINVECWL